MQNYSPNTGDTQRLYSRPADPEPEAIYQSPPQTKLAMLLMVLCGLTLCWYLFHPSQNINSTAPSAPITIVDNSSHIRVLCWCPDGDTYGEYRP